MKEIILSGQSVQIDMLVKAGIIPHGTPPEQIVMFAHTCKVMNLDPIKKEVYLIPRNTKNGKIYSVCVSIDGMRKKASETGLYMGCTDVVYNKKSDGAYQTKADLNGVLPQTAHIIVYKMVQGQKCAFENSVSFKEFYGNSSDYSLAKTMPLVMIDKVVKMRALKDAFSAELGSLSIEEETPAYEGNTMQAVEVTGYDVEEEKRIEKIVQSLNTREELAQLYNANRQKYSIYGEVFTQRKNEIDEQNNTLITN